MKDKIVLTDNMTHLVAGVEALVNKPERSDRIALIYGKWGHGKTTGVEWYFTHNPSFFQRSMAAWTRSPNMMLEDLLKAYRVEARGRFKSDIRELIRVAKRHRLPLFIDEADRVVRKSILIETIRDLHDIARIPIILIGQENIINLLQRRDLGQVFSRITEIIEFQELNTRDIQNVSSELCNLECSSKVASYIHTVTIGDFRLLNALLTKAESLCAFNKTSEITLSIAKAASSAMPHIDDLNKGIQNEEDFDSGGSQAVQAAG